MTDIREIMARAAYIAHHKSGPTEESLAEPNMGRGGYKTEVAVWRAVAGAMKDAIREAGYALVPVEPTEAMVEAAVKAWHERPDMALDDDCAATYTAMIAAGEVKP